MEIVLAWSRVRAGFGSKESTCETPPDMLRKMTDLARGEKCGARGARGSMKLVGDALALPRINSETMPDASSVPATPERMKDRRVGSCRMTGQSTYSISLL